MDSEARKESADRRSGSIIVLLASIIAVAFLVIVFLFFRQARSMTVLAVQNTTDAVASQASDALAACMRDQTVNVRNAVADEYVLEALGTERRGVPRTEVMTTLEPVLRKLVADVDQSWVFVASARSHVVYRSDGKILRPSKDEVDVAWLEGMLEAGITDADHPTYQLVDQSVIGEQRGLDNVMLYGRVLMQDDEPVAVLGTAVRASVLTYELRRVLEKGELEAGVFVEDGSLWLGTPSLKSIDDVFSEFPLLTRLSLEELRNEESSWHAWDNMESLLSGNQQLYEVRYLEDFDAYLLLINSATSLFNAMRTRLTVVIVALLVVMVLLILMVANLVTWYRGRLIRIATTDELTGLANRKYFAQAYERLLTDSSDHRLALALIDVDHFKQVNDTYGHAGGDRVLATIAREVSHLAGKQGLAGRWGGDEFIAVVDAQDCDPFARAEEMIARVASLEVEGGIHTSISMGMCDIDVGMPLERMVERADDALYVTMRAGAAS